MAVADGPLAAGVAARVAAGVWELDRRMTALRHGDGVGLMGILNLTPDSFSDGGRLYRHLDAVIDAAATMDAAGVTVFDVGGESSRPGAVPVSADEELERVLPVVAALSARFVTPVSVDTVKPEVMVAALASGAAMINDISGHAAIGSAARLAPWSPWLCLMHMRGTPQTMRALSDYRDLLGEVGASLRSAWWSAVAAGHTPSRLMLDPGLGFAKTADGGRALLRGLLPGLRRLGTPLLLGLSRKSMLGAIAGLPHSGGRDAVSQVAMTVGEHAPPRVPMLYRVHDVVGHAQAFRVCAALR